MTKQIKLTGSELAILRIAFVSSDGNGHDFGFTEDIVKAMRGAMSAQAVGALVTSLQRKGIFEVYEPVTTDSGTWHQFVFKLPISELEAMLRV